MENIDFDVCETGEKSAGVGTGGRASTVTASEEELAARQGYRIQPGYRYFGEILKNDSAGITGGVNGAVGIRQVKRSIRIQFALGTAIHRGEINKHESRIINNDIPL